MQSHCPSVVVCAGSRGVAIGHVLARLARHRSALGLIVLEAASDKGSCTVRPVTGDETGDPEKVTLEKAVGSFLSIGNPTLAIPADPLLALRMVLVGEYGEISAALLTHLIGEL